MRIIRRPEVAPCRPPAAVPELILRDRVSIGVNGGEPVLHLMPLVVVKALIECCNNRLLTDIGHRDRNRLGVDAAMAIRYLDCYVVHIVVALVSRSLEVR